MKKKMQTHKSSSQFFENVKYDYDTISRAQNQQQQMASGASIVWNYKNEKKKKFK